MIKLLLKLLGCFLLLLTALPVWAQAPLAVQVAVEELGYTGRKRDAVFKFYLDSANGTPLNPGGRCYAFSHKDDLRRFFAAKDTALKGPNALLQTFTVAQNPNQIFTLAMECFDKDRGEICTFTKKDGRYSLVNYNFKIDSIPPGDYSDTFRITDAAEGYYAILKVRYHLPLPTTPAPQEKSAIWPAHENMVLQSALDLQNRQGLRYEWQFRTGNQNWQAIPNTGSNPLKITINPVAQLFGGQLATTTPVWLRLKITSRDTFALSPEFEQYFTPQPPLADANNTVIGKSCKGAPTGSLVMRNLKSELPNIAYALLRSNGENPACLPDEIEPGCSSLVRSGTTNNGQINLTRLPAGKYTLLLYHPQMKVGPVYSRYDVEINNYTSFTIEKLQIRNPTCTNPQPGEATITLAGGDWERASVVLNPVAGEETWDKNILQFKNLPGGQYKLSMTDGCSDLIDTSFTLLSEPPKLIIDSIKRVRANTKDGSVEIRLHLRNGMGPFKVNILDEKNYLKTESHPSTNILLNLFKGRNNINIVDETDPNCLIADTLLIVDAGKMQLTQEASASAPAPPHPLETAPNNIVKPTARAIGKHPVNSPPAAPTGSNPVAKQKVYLKTLISGCKNPVAGINLALTCPQIRVMEISYAGWHINI